MKKYPVTIRGEGTDSPEILIHGPVGRSFWSDEGISSADFINELAKIPKGKKVTVGINSQGGSIQDGLAIFNAINARRDDVTARIDGYAVSIASVIPLAASRVVSPKSSVWMIHDPWSLTQGNADDHRKSADMLDTHADVLVSAYADKTKKKPDAIRAAMKAETWLSGEEALDWGLSDEANDEKVTLNSIDFAPFQNTPQSLKDFVQNSGNAPATVLNFRTQPAPSQGGAKPPKEPTMKDKMIAALKSRGVKVADDATDEWILAEYGKSVTPEPNPIALQLQDITAQLEREKRSRITLAIDNLILDNKVTVSERDAEIALCLGDESRMAEVLAKRTPIVPGAEPIRSITEGLLPRDEIRRLPTADGRFRHMRNNWNALWADAQIRDRRHSGVLAANTYSSDLVTDFLSDSGITTLQHKLAMLAAFTLKYDLDPKKPLAQVQIPHTTGGGTTQVDATNFQTSGNSVVSAIGVTVHQYTQSFHVSNADLQSGLDLSVLTTINAAKLGNTVIEVVNALLTTGNFATNTSITSAFAAFNFSELADAWGKLQKSPIKNAVLNGQYMSRIINTPGMFQAAGTGDGAGWAKFGWDRIESNSNWTGAGTGVNGIACNPQAVLVGMAMPKSPPQGIPGNTLQQTTITLEGLNITIQQNLWFALSSRELWASYDVMFGAALGDETAGVLFKTS